MRHPAWPGDNGAAERVPASDAGPGRGNPEPLWRYLRREPWVLVAALILLALMGVAVVVGG
jgi:hypothetical protein